MTTVYDVPPGLLIRKASDELRDIESVEPPVWAGFAKTGVHKQMPPADEDWWYIRSAAVLRRIYLDGPVGVQRMRSFYGGKKDRGSSPYRFKRGSGSVLRKTLQQLEEAGFVESVPKGRVISAAGRAFLDKTAHSIREDTEGGVKAQTSA